MHTPYTNSASAALFRILLELGSLRVSWVVEASQFRRVIRAEDSHGINSMAPTFQYNSPGRMKDIVVEPVDPTKDNTAEAQALSADSAGNQLKQAPTHPQIVDKIRDDEAARDDGRRENRVLQWAHV